MNIDLRNISEEFENQVNAIKKEFQISTNSKAVEFCTLNYLSQLKTIEDLRSMLHNALTDAKLKQIKIDNFKSAFSDMLK
ncbi:hypothetical protein [Flavobacterium sp. PL02]|uniref:hypothetical protein n=1 Tax=Flavobacterium sp. PL02 TaxID=3088354 RepID=UPI002B23C3BF|nr:hypothetical protein [Flavobacterium sp. PL02]MEA9415913.1 hypothetical protein [Flavobacterium sp. PL02]